jgi:hypothetical protein
MPIHPHGLMPGHEGPGSPTPAFIAVPDLSDWFVDVAIAGGEIGTDAGSRQLETGDMLTPAESSTNGVGNMIVRHEVVRLPTDRGIGGALRASMFRVGLLEEALRARGIDPDGPGVGIHEIKLEPIGEPPEPPIIRIYTDGRG